MIRFIGLRLLRIVLSLLVVSLVTFLLVQAVPGSYADVAAAQAQGTAGGVTIHNTYGSDVPAWLRYWRFVWGFVRLHMGPSFKYPSQSVEHIIGQALPVSAALAVTAVLVALAIAIPVGVLAAVRHDSRVDYWSMFTVTVAHSIPNFLLAVLLILTMSRGLHVLPTGGWTGPKSMVLPVLSLALPIAAVLARYMRASMITTLNEEYVLAAMSKGGSLSKVVYRHALRNSLTAIVTVTGPTLASLTTGTVFIETVFRIPGLGRYFTDAATSRDIPLLMGTTMFFALVLMVMNLAVDLIYGMLDPRVRVRQFGERSRLGRLRRNGVRTLAPGGGR